MQGFIKDDKRLSVKMQIRISSNEILQSSNCMYDSYCSFKIMYLMNNPPKGGITLIFVKLVLINNLKTYSYEEVV